MTFKVVLKSKEQARVFSNISAGSEPEAIEWGDRQAKHWGWKNIKVTANENTEQSATPTAAIKPAKPVKVRPKHK